MVVLIKARLYILFEQMVDRLLNNGMLFTLIVFKTLIILEKKYCNFLNIKNKFIQEKKKIKKKLYGIILKVK